MVLVFKAGGAHPNKSKTIAGYNFKYGSLSVKGNKVTCGNAEIIMYHRQIIPELHVFDSDAERSEYWEHMRPFYARHYDKGRPVWSI